MYNERKKRSFSKNPRVISGYSFFFVFPTPPTRSRGTPRNLRSLRHTKRLVLAETAQIHEVITQQFRGFQVKTALTAFQMVRTFLTAAVLAAVISLYCFSDPLFVNPDFVQSSASLLVYMRQRTLS